MAAACVVSVVGDGPAAAPAALVAAWLSDELGPATVRVRIDPPGVVTVAGHGDEPRLADRIEHALREQRFAGWALAHR